MLVLFFKHVTAYEMRISDWSSDVCSSDLAQVQTGRWSFRLQLSWQSYPQSGRLMHESVKEAARMIPIKAFCFDVFGTVVDWRSCIARDAAIFFDRHGLSRFGLGGAACRERVCQEG